MLHLNVALRALATQLDTTTTHLIVHRNFNCAYVQYETWLSQGSSHFRKSTILSLAMSSCSMNPIEAFKSN